MVLFVLVASLPRYLSLKDQSLNADQPFLYNMLMMQHLQHTALQYVRHVCAAALVTAHGFLLVQWFYIMPYHVWHINLLSYVNCSLCTLICWSVT